MLSNTTFLITGIADKHSLAMYVAKEIIKQGGKVVCTGLGVSAHHENLSEKAKAFLNKNFQDFKEAVTEELGDSSVEILDVTLDENIDSFARSLSEKNIKEISRIAVSPDGQTLALVAEPEINKEE